MTLCRVKHDKSNPYTMVNRTITEDPRISWKAKGIWLYAFSRPNDWTFYLADLVKRSTDGKESVSSGLRELEKFGYLERTQTRMKDGKMGPNEWLFHEVPQEIKKSSPQTENPSTVDPSTDNPPLLNNNPIPNKKNNNPAEPEAPSAVVVSSHLIGLEGISLPLARKLTKKYTDEQLAQAVKCLKDVDAECVPAVLVSALNEGWVPNTPPEDRGAEAKEHIEKIRHWDGKQLEPYTIQVGPDYVLFRHSCIDGSKDVCFRVAQKGMVKKLKEFVTNCRKESEKYGKN